MKAKGLVSVGVEVVGANFEDSEGKGSEEGYGEIWHLTERTGKIEDSRRYEEQ